MDNLNSALVRNDLFIPDNAELATDSVESGTSVVNSALPNNAELTRKKNPLGEPDKDWFSLSSKELLDRFGTVQEALDGLAEKHQTQSWEEELTPERFKEIRDLTSEPVYISTVGLGCTFPIRTVTYIRTTYPTMFYKFEEGLLKMFPVLKQYPHWYRLTDRIGETNCHQLTGTIMDFIMRKDAEHRIEEELK